MTASHVFRPSFRINVYKFQPFTTIWFAKYSCLSFFNLMHHLNKPIRNPNKKSCLYKYQETLLLIYSCWLLDFKVMFKPQRQPRFMFSKKHSLGCYVQLFVIFQSTHNVYTANQADVSIHNFLYTLQNV